MLLHHPGTDVTEAYALRQQQLADSRQAEGQCQMCGAFRLDGRPPTVHRYRCRSGGPDGETVGVLRTGTAWQSYDMGYKRTDTDPAPRRRYRPA